MPKGGGREDDDRKGGSLYGCVEKRRENVLSLTLSCRSCLVFTHGMRVAMPNLRAAPGFVEVYDLVSGANGGFFGHGF